MSDSSRMPSAERPGARVHLRLDLGTGGRIGPGKIDLLEAVGRTGSIAAAGRTMGMSFRRAWLLINAVNAMFDEAVVAGFDGDERGGGTILTPFGVRLVAAYRNVEAQARDSAAREFTEMTGHLAMLEEPAEPKRGR